MQAMFSVAFWNVKLSPPSSTCWNKSTVEQKENVSKTLQLFFNLNWDFICLCEVSPEDLAFIDQQIKIIGSGYDYVIEHNNYGGLYFDTCVIYKNDNELLSNTYIVDGETRDKIKAYQKYEFYSQIFKERIIFYVVHWLSQRADNNEKRRSVASFIRSDIVNEQKRMNSTKMVVIGDFNVEPYDSAILDGLRSSRDLNVVKENPSLMYNPFWKFLPIQDHETSGTHFYKDEYHHWHIYDQVLVSGSFFSDGWELCKDKVHILDDGLLCKLTNGKSLKNPSDHFPILAILEKNNA